MTSIPADAHDRAASFVVPRAATPRRIVVAMSGGVDSSVAAWLLKEAGHDVIGVSLRLAPDDGADLAVRHGRCCSHDDMTDARRVADALGVPFYAIDARDRFRAAVYEPFIASYRQGLTPIPCLACNHDVKLGDLLETARDLGAALATGHYARRIVVDTPLGARAALVRPVDRARDQTYWLYGTPADVLDEIELPLGDYDKPLIRALAARAQLPVATKPDSQEICFVPDGDHARIVEQDAARTGARIDGGALVHIGGRKLGTHGGVHHFTVGQRRGTHVAQPETGEKLYVVDVDAASSTVVLGPRAALRVTRVRAQPMRLAMPIAAWPARIVAQVRARHRAASATWEVDDDGALTVTFDEPIEAVALGQALVCYAPSDDGDVLLGGGVITGRLDGAAPRMQQLAR